MDWKLEQLERMGAREIWLICGPFTDEFEARYGDFCDIYTDNQTGIANALGVVRQDMHWTMGDVLLEQPLIKLNEPTMYVRRDNNPNIAGIWLDCGLYYGKSGFKLVETDAEPYHINTHADLQRCHAYLR